MSIIFEVPINEWIRLYVEEKADSQYDLIIFDVEMDKELSSKRFVNVHNAIEYCKLCEGFVKEYFD
jgi:hypothetical protein